MARAMAKGSFLGSERRLFVDEETGSEMIRLSGFPTINRHVYMHSRCFTYDSKDAVFYSQRQLARGSPSDILAVSVDGMNLRQVTERDGVGWMTCSPVERSVLYACGSSIWKADLDDFAETEIAHSPEGMSFAIISVSHDQKRVASFCNPQGRGHMMLTDLIRDSTEVVYVHPSSIGHLQFEPTHSKWVMFHDGNPKSQRPRLWCINSDGSDARMVYDGSQGDPSHFVWLSGKGEILSTLQAECPGILRIPLEGEVVHVSHDEHFWHAGSSLDGEMICSDTLKPDTGIHLVNPDTGMHRKLCLSKSSNSHPQWTHPHPAWSPDGKKVLFGSDREGTPQVFLAKVRDDLLPR